MAALAFRNLEASPHDPVHTWPYEGLVTAIERGLLPDWRRIVAEVREAPWGQVARDVEAYAEYGTERRAIALLMEAVRRARSDAEADERRQVACRVDQAITEAGVSALAFAREVGTSASRLSTYRTGAVQPSAGMLLRIEATSHRLRARREG